MPLAGVAHQKMLSPKAQCAIVEQLARNLVLGQRLQQRGRVEGRAVLGRVLLVQHAVLEVAIRIHIGVVVAERIDRWLLQADRQGFGELPFVVGRE
jgi:hypothetical protein